MAKMSEKKMIAAYRAAIRRKGVKPNADRQDPKDMQIARLDNQLRRLKKKK